MISTTKELWKYAENEQDPNRQTIESFFGRAKILSCVSNELHIPYHSEFLIGIYLISQQSDFCENLSLKLKLGENHTFSLTSKVIFKEKLFHILDSVDSSEYNFLQDVIPLFALNKDYPRLILDFEDLDESISVIAIYGYADRNNLINMMDPKGLVCELDGKTKIIICPKYDQN